MLFGCGVGTQTVGGAPLPVYSRNCGSGSPIQCHEGRVQLDTGDSTFRFGSNRQHYVFLGNSFTSDSMMANDATYNRLSLVSHKLSAGTWLTCAAGAQDATIIARGNEIKAWQDAHRGVGKWGATFVWTFHHEPNNGDHTSASSPNSGTTTASTGRQAWRDAFAHILDLWYNTCGVVRWDGDANFHTRTEGLITSINLSSGIASGFTADWDNFWGNNAMMDQMCVMAAGDPYNTGTNCRTFENINSDLRAWGVTKKAQQDAAGRTFMTGIFETGTVEAAFQSGTDASWTATGLAKTKANWYLNASQYLKSGNSLLSLWTYYDDAPAHPNQPDSTQASWDSWLANFCTSDFEIGTSAIPGGTGPSYHWNISAGTLPAGLSLAQDGLITGTPTTQQASTFTVRAVDAVAASATRQLTLTIGVLSPTITSNAILPGAEVGIPYSVQLTVSGGTPPYTWAQTSGNIPPGVSFSSAGVFSGTPTIANTKNFDITVTDSAARSDLKAMTITTSPVLTFVTPTQPHARVGRPYSYTFVRTGGVDPFSWVADDPSDLPNGMDVSNDGVLEGTPTHFGTYPIQVSVSDANQVAAHQTVTLIVDKHIQRPRRGVSVRGTTSAVAEE